MKINDMKQLINQQRFYFQDFTKVSDSLNEIYDFISSNGYALLSMEKTDRETFIQVMRLFGNFQHHVRSDNEGVVGINKSEVLKIKDVKEKYSGLNNKEFLPHTDGSYLNGMVKYNNCFAHIGPPAMIGLQCERPAKSGGENIIIDGNKIFLDLLENEPDLLKFLLRDDCLYICRDDQAALNLPLFQYKGDNLWRIRIRSDRMVFCNDRSYEPMRKFVKNYTLNEKYYKYISLEAGQILIIDNFRILHGRVAFQREESVKTDLKRSMRRIWISENPLTKLKNMNDSGEKHRVFDNYSDYLSSSEELFKTPLRLGIKLSHDDTMKCLNLKTSSYGKK